MRAPTSATLLAALMVIGAGGVATATAGERIVEPAARSFRNCTALNRVYPQGVGRPNAVNRVNGRRTNDANHKKSRALYRANRDLDRDGDGVACER